MKTKVYFLYALITVFIFSFYGCYTIAWSPNEKLPDDYYSDEDIEAECYYPQAYYGHYNTFYGGSWWSHSGIISESIKNAKDQKYIRNQSGNRSTEQTTFVPTRPVNSNATAPTVGTSINSGSSSSGAAKTQQSESTRQSQNSGSDTKSETKDVRNSNNNRSPNNDSNSSSSSDSNRGSTQGSGADRGRR